MARSTAGCSASYKAATRALLRSTASKYWVRSLLPMERKSTRRAISCAWYTADGTSTITPSAGIAMSSPCSSNSRCARSTRRRASSTSAIWLTMGSRRRRMIERDADAAPAKKGIVFMDREIRERLVAADVERAQHHRPRREGLQHLTIDAPLRLLAGEAVADHEGEFGAIETDTLRAVRERLRDVGDEARIGVQGQAHAVRRLGWQVAQPLEAREELRLFVGETRVLAAHRLRRIGVHAATVAGDDERASLHASGGEVTGAHHRGHTPRARADKVRACPRTRARVR